MQLSLHASAGLGSASCLLLLPPPPPPLLTLLPHTLALPSPAGKVMRGGGGGRNTPFNYTSTAAGRASAAEAQGKLDADAQLLAGEAAAAGAAAGSEAAAAGGEEEADE